MYWGEVEGLLTDVSRVYGLLASNPESRRILDTPRGRSYLNRQVKRLYEVLYELAWGS